MSVAPGHKQGHSKCYIGEIGKELDRLVKSSRQQMSHLECANRRGEFQDLVRKFTQDSQLGTLKCVVCGKEYVYAKALLTHQAKWHCPNVDTPSVLGA